MKQRILLAALALSLCISIGMATATTVPTMNVPCLTYESYTDRPGNFIMNDYATMSGYNSFQASSLANAGGVDEMTKVAVLPVDMCLGAPVEKSYQSVNMNFWKNGQTVDPAVQETVQSDITVGAVNPATGSFTVPTINADGSLNGDANERYDLFSSTVGGTTGTPTVGTGNVLTGITDDGSHQVFSTIQSVQDDWITATGADSAGTDSNVLSSFTTASLPTNTGAVTPYVQFDWQDARGWKPVTNDANGLWTIQNTVNYKMEPIEFNTQFNFV